MNLAQIIRKARFHADAIRTGNVLSAMWSDEEMVDLVNTAADRAYKVMRLCRSMVIAKTMTTTDVSIVFPTETYAPSSLRIVSGTSDYTLPPDFVKVCSMRPVTANFDDIRFRPIDPASKDYIDDRSLPASSLSSVESATATYHYFVLGSRTMRFIPTPQDTIDIEILYWYRPHRLLTYSLLSVDVTNASAAVAETDAGGNATWLTSGIRTPAELEVGSATLVSLNSRYPSIASIDTETTLTLTTVYGGATVTDSPYIIAMVPILPEEHHSWLAQMTAAIMLSKVSLDDSMKAQQSLEQELVNEVTAEVSSQQSQESLTIEPYEIAD